MESNDLVKIETNLTKYQNREIFNSFVNGVWWGLILIGFINLCAWLISVMRQRVYVANRDIKENIE